jgi:hypothetical protein
MVAPVTAILHRQCGYRLTMASILDSSSMEKSVLEAASAFSMICSGLEAPIRLLLYPAL